MIDIDIAHWNKELHDKSPEEIVNWALKRSQKPIVTTSFGVYSAVLLHTFYKLRKEVDIIWCDTGYNTKDTYNHAIDLMNRLQLNMHVYVPLKSNGFIDATLGVPQLDHPNHEEFTEVVKLEPFRRALAEHQPDVWFTNIRNRQTAFRSSKDILSYSKEGILKVSPFYYWSDAELDQYLDSNELPKNEHYFDPTKVLQHRECGIHLQ
ncbi:MAG: phosphoadenosine phosphosulfate reductase family protein [Flavobacteriaceae bacterium]|nr:phosphoadenosine phosphosulfate reductase family protein [Flavobacteriaceae bacterium]